MDSIIFSRNELWIDEQLLFTSKITIVRTLFIQNQHCLLKVSLENKDVGFKKNEPNLRKLRRRISNQQ